MRGVRTSIGIVSAGLAALLAPLPAQAGCTRTIVNKSPFTAVVSRDGGPGVRIPPHRSQAIRYSHPGRLDLSLVCGHSGAGATVYRGSFTYTAILDRCYVDYGEGFFEEQIGPSFFGITDTKPLTINVPRQGDVVIGPVVEERCPLGLREALRARH